MCILGSLIIWKCTESLTVNKIPLGFLSGVCLKHSAGSFLSELILEQNGVKKPDNNNKSPPKTRGWTELSNRHAHYSRDGSRVSDALMSCFFRLIFSKPTCFLHSLPALTSLYVYFRKLICNMHQRRYHSSSLHTHPHTHTHHKVSHLTLFNHRRHYHHHGIMWKSAPRHKLAVTFIFQTKNAPVPTTRVI